MLVAVTAGLLIGVLVSVSPLLAMAGALVLLAAIVVSSIEDLPRAFLLALAAGLIGYAFLGRGFAYLGFGSLFVGEMLLGFALLAGLVRIRSVRFTALHFLIIAFMVWGLSQTIPYVGVYGIDALRDAVVWGYALFALIVSQLIKREHIATIVSWYGRILPFYVSWAPFALIGAVFLGDSLLVPGTNTPLLTARPGEWAVHIAAGGAFILLGLWSRYPVRRTASEVLLWVSWGGAAALTAAMNRGSFLAIAIVTSLAMLLRPAKHILTAMFAAVLLLTVVLLVDPQFELGGHHREFSVDQFTRNLQSLFVSTGEQTLDVTRQWRLQWWSDIVDYTVFGEYRWTGKGFGVNLANDDGYQTFGDDGPAPLRSPHNGYMTVLARSGVPGFAIWVALQATFFVSLAMTAYRAIRAGRHFWFQVSTWILLYWIAMTINISFEVYIEGPQGGIWFWVVFGMGIAVMRIYREIETSNSPASLGKLGRLVHA